jgi:hypothetical protein
MPMGCGFVATVLSFPPLDLPSRAVPSRMLPDTTQRYASEMSRPLPSAGGVLVSVRPEGPPARKLANQSKRLCRPEPDRKFLAIVKREMAKQPNFRGVVDEQQAVESWDNITLCTIQALIYSSRVVLLQ